MKGYVYIFCCSDDSYYTGSTTNLELRLAEHLAGKGANYTKKCLPVELVYYEEYERIDGTFFVKNKYKVGVVKKRSTDQWNDW